MRIEDIYNYIEKNPSLIVGDSKTDCHTLLSSAATIIISPSSIDLTNYIKFSNGTISFEEKDMIRRVDLLEYYFDNIIGELTSLNNNIIVTSYYNNIKLNLESSLIYDEIINEVNSRIEALTTSYDFRFLNLTPLRNYQSDESLSVKGVEVAYEALKLLI